MIKTETKILMASEEMIQSVGQHMFILSFLYRLFSYHLYIFLWKIFFNKIVWEH